MLSLALSFSSALTVCRVHRCALFCARSLSLGPLFCFPNFLGPLFCFPKFLRPYPRRAYLTLTRYHTFSHLFHNRFRPSIHLGLLPEYVLRLTDDESITPDSQVDPAEQLRRRTLSSMRYKGVVKINGKPVTSTPYIPFDSPQLSVNFKQYFEFRLIHQPSELLVDLYVRSSDGCMAGDVFVASVPVPIPGMVG